MQKSLTPKRRWWPLVAGGVAVLAVLSGLDFGAEAHMSEARANQTSVKTHGAFYQLVGRCTNNACQLGA